MWEALIIMPPVLQEGIYWDKGQRPGNFFAILFLRANDGASAQDVGSLLNRLWSTYQGLKNGIVPDLGAGFPVPAGNLTVLVGYGPNIFRLKGITQPLPAGLGPQSRFRSPSPDGGGPLLLDGGLPYGQDIRDNVATEEICIQFISDTQLAGYRAIVETWKVLQTADRIAGGVPALSISGFFTGFQRDDGRSWIDFHDGISNLQSGDDRRRVIAVKSENAGGDAWTIGGSYLAFIRLGLNLSAWWSLPVAQQQVLVGRDKFTGCPLVSSAGGGAKVAGCPIPGTLDITTDANQAFRETPPPTSVTLEIFRSHAHRANHHSVPIERVDSRRIFRQGFEFLEPSNLAPEFRVGLNFVSFQDDPTRLTFVLTQPDWLGQINFGGTPNTLSLLDVRAAGIYFAPPVVVGEGFPGSHLFPGS